MPKILSLYLQAIDVSPLRRVNQAIYFITKGARDHTMKTMKTFAECLADEIINCAKNNAQSSWAIKKKDEIEKVAKTNRWREPANHDYSNFFYLFPL